MYTRRAAQNGGEHCGNHAPCGRPRNLAENPGDKAEHMLESHAAVLEGLRWHGIKIVFCGDHCFILKLHEKMELVKGSRKVVRSHRKSAASPVRAVGGWETSKCRSMGGR